MGDEVRTFLDEGGCSQYLYDLGTEYRFLVKCRNSSPREFRLNLSTAIKQSAKGHIKFLECNHHNQWIDMTSLYATHELLHINSF